MPSPESPTSSYCPGCGTFIPEPVSACPVCGSDLTVTGASVAHARSPADEDLALVRGALQEDYDVTRELGRGGMAVVYLARERRLEREVAIKVLSLARSGDQSLVERFLREARTAAKLEHPHIIPIHRVGEVGRVIYFAMKFVAGPSLAAILRQRTKLPPDEIRSLLAEVGSALGYAARRGVVHRDIKPDNILRDEESGHFIVTDFGIARSADASPLTEAGMSVGTPRYMSPEQASARSLDGRSDIYSLGVVAYQCLTGRPPFEERESMAVLYAHVNTPLPRPVLATDEERALFAIVERMLAKDPARRPQTGDELVSLAAPAASVESSSGEPTEILDTGHQGREQLDSLRSAVTGASNAARRVSASLQQETARAWSKAKPHLLEWIARFLRTRAVTWLTVSPRRVVGAVVAAIVVLWGGKTTLHFATKHASRCPEGTSAFTVLLDEVGTVSLGRDLDVYYDVCGLERGTPYTVRLHVSRGAGGIRGLLGGRTSPVTLSFDEQARGPATRRHRTIVLPELQAGSYALQVSVSTDDGRDGSRSHDFQLVER